MVRLAIDDISGVGAWREKAKSSTEQVLVGSHRKTDGTPSTTLYVSRELRSRRRTETVEVRETFNEEQPRLQSCQESLRLVM